MDSLYIIIPSAALLFFFITFLFFHFKKKSAIQKVNSLRYSEKDALLDTLAELIGYGYDAGQDLFVARLDAPQKVFGYTTLFDLSAPYFNMIFDYETIYFDYVGKTWLIEMWKGQYGINTGCELGVYYADKIVSPDEYDTTHFKSVDDKDMLTITLDLNRVASKNQLFSERVGKQKSRHWWMTMFKTGLFTTPEKLFVNTTIRFKDYHMMCRFLNSFEKTLPDVHYRVDHLTVYFTFDKSSRQYSFFKRLIRHLALTACSLYCGLFNFITRPFDRSGDKVLYLYYYLPFLIRLIFKKKSQKRHQHHKK